MKENQFYSESEDFNISANNFIDEDNRNTLPNKENCSM